MEWWGLRRRIEWRRGREESECVSWMWSGKISNADVKTIKWQGKKVPQEKNPFLPRNEQLHHHYAIIIVILVVFASSLSTLREYLNILSTAIYHIVSIILCMSYIHAVHAFIHKIFLKILLKNKWTFKI